ncbi:hypothetical protein IHV10_10995 [Fictibacillus sp. 5RED26]|uniref:hypothetical protein n=1 Tax=Fictibacillus sp. 5RED26 TaxID=2745876 RepID=UPI0018CD65EF|nr:hypothetical protein [Fictibacillus sp. 5RED26]MBH0156896.1 hypothetical protein [Fictibacillus sp. 5RED26]
MEFKYQLSGRGWASGSIKINNKEFNFIASYLTDSLSDLLKSLITITPGCVPYPINESTFNMEEEPERLVWKFEKQNDRDVLITIIKVSGIERSIVFKEQCLLSDFIKAVVNSISKLLKKHGIEGYRENWVNHDFPLNEYQRLYNYMSKKVK